MWFEENFAELANKLIDANLAKNLLNSESSKSEQLTK